MTKVVHDTDVGSGLEIAGGKLGVAASMATDAEVAAAIAAASGGGGTEPTLIYTDTNDPNTATVFDDENPPVANDDALKQDSQYLYVGADGSQWTWNGTAYITSPQNTTVGAGSSAAITRIFPASPTGTFLSASATGLFVFEGIRFDIKWLNSNYYIISLVNTTASAVTLKYNFANGSLTTATIVAGAVQSLNNSLWNASPDETVFTVIVNNKWYVLRTVAYQSGTARMVHMVLQRR